MPAESPVVVVTPVQGTIVEVCVTEGDVVSAGATLAIVESMKMEHLIEAPADGIVGPIVVEAGATVGQGDRVLALGPAPDRPAETEPSEQAATAAVGTGPRPIRADLAAVVDRHAVGLDDHRPDAVARRHDRGHRSARENLDDLLDPGSFVEYGPLAIAAQRARRSVEELIERTPADGLVGGVGRVDGRPVVAMAYDVTVLAGTQGFQNHRKKDRLLEIAARQRLPVVLFAEGGGGRPGDTDAPGVSGLDVLAFDLFGQLSGWVPLVGIASGRCFAGNAALLGCCDVIIATEDSNIGMGGPAMIEGGGLGVVTPEEIGPVAVQQANGVIDVVVADDVAAVAAARQYLSYFAPPGDPAGESVAPVAPAASAPDQSALRDLVPEQRLRVYDVHTVIDTLADDGAVLELRAGFGRGMVTALARIDSRPLGIVANNPLHLGGAIDADGADKAARFLQLCDAHDLPVLFLCDTPGIMVGPAAEETALVRHVNRLFVTGSNVGVPTGTIILRKGYGLGAMAMCGGSFKSPLFCVAWPTGEVGGMGLEGAITLGFRRELDAVADPAEREALYESLVAAAYQRGQALNSASHFEMDDVIDPAESRRWIATLFTNDAAAAATRHRLPKKRSYIDTW